MTQRAIQPSWGGDESLSWEGAPASSERPGIRHLAAGSETGLGLRAAWPLGSRGFPRPMLLGRVSRRPGMPQHAAGLHEPNEAAAGRPLGWGRCRAREAVACFVDWWASPPAGRPPAGVQAAGVQPYAPTVRRRGEANARSERSDMPQDAAGCAVGACGGRARTAQRVAGAVSDAARGGVESGWKLGVGVCMGLRLLRWLACASRRGPSVKGPATATRTRRARGRRASLAAGRRRPAHGSTSDTPFATCTL